MNSKVYDDTSLNAFTTTLDAHFNIQPIDKQVVLLNQDTANDQPSVKTTFTPTPAIDSSLQEDQNPSN